MESVLEARLAPLRPQVQGHILAMVRDQAEAEELTQDTFARAVERVEQLRDPQAALAWLYRIATTVTLDHLRRRRPATVPLDEDEHGERTPSLLETTLERSEMSECVDG
ncbi:MAG: RNA polymerase sigma factor, partial [Gaiellaceae bacterium]